MATFLQNAYLRILVTYALGVMAAMTVSEAVTELGAIARDFHITGHGQVGLVMSLPSLMVALGALLAGYTVDRIGDRVVLLIGAIIIVSGDLLVIAAPTFKLLLICRAITGVGYVLTAVAAVTLLIRITTARWRWRCGRPLFPPVFCCRSCRPVSPTTLPTGGRHSSPTPY